MRNTILTHTLRLGVCLMCTLMLPVPLSARSNGLYSTRSSNGQSISMDVAMGIGYSQLGYQTTDANASTIGDYGLNAHLGINYFFTTYFGVGIGADFTRYGQSLSLSNRDLTWQGVTDTDADDMVYGELYDHTLHIYSWKERQQQLYVAPQVLLMSVIPLQNVSLTIEAGVEYAFCVQASYKASGDIEHTGFYPKWGLTLHDVPAHGFYRTTDFAPSGLLEDQFANRQQLSIVGKMGVQIPLTERLDLRLNALCKYAVYVSPNTSNTAGGDAQLGSDVGFYENRTPLAEGERDPHYFIPHYAPLTTTTLVGGKYNPLIVGLEIGIRYRIPLGKSQPCRCIVD